MNQRPVFPPNFGIDDTDRARPGIGIEIIIAITRRQWRIVVVFTAVFLAFGLIYCLTATPQYTARATILIDRGNDEAARRVPVIGRIAGDEASVLDQVELLKSDMIALAVIDRLELQDNPEFLSQGGGLIAGAFEALGFIIGMMRRPDTPEDNRKAALTCLHVGLEIARAGRSHVVEISFTALSPKLAADVAQATAEAYLDDKLNAKNDANRQVSDWLQSRIEELRQQFLASDLAVRRFRVAHGLAGVDDRLAELNSVPAADSEPQAQLRELEQSAETHRDIYRTFLQRYRESVQQQSFPFTEARIISPAVPPARPSEPRLALLLIWSLALGSLTGGAVAGFREFRDRFFRTGLQVREALDMEYLGSVPKIAPFVTTPSSAEPVNPAGSWCNRPRSLTSFVLDHPLSAFAETMRKAKLAADFNIAKPRRVIGVVSALPGEGKSIVAINLARLLAKSARTLLIDAHLRNPGATRALARHAEQGLVELLLGSHPPSSVLLTDPLSGLKFLPSVSQQHLPNSSELLASPQMTRLLSLAASRFDYIVLDLPPLGPLVDVRAIAPILDGFILVVEWGETHRQVVRDALNGEQRVASRCLGVVLNKVDDEKMKLYQEHGSSDYYAARYAAYYHDHQGPWLQ